MVKFKTFFRTVAFIATVLFSTLVWYGYTFDGEQRAKASIPSLPNFEQSTNQ